MDKKLMKMVSNVNTNEADLEKKGKIKIEPPKVIGLYNKFKGGVDQPLLYWFC